MNSICSSRGCWQRFPHMQVNNFASCEEQLRSQKIGLAVSGGPDSMALGFLASRFFDPKQLRAFTVEHNLSHMGVNEDGESVKRRLSEMGISCDVLRLDWEDFPIHAQTKGKLQSLARDKRYQIML